VSRQSHATTEVASYRLIIPAGVERDPLAANAYSATRTEFGVVVVTAGDVNVEPLPMLEPKASMGFWVSMPAYAMMPPRATTAAENVHV
jgi:hypothetical protein